MQSQRSAMEVRSLDHIQAPRLLDVNDVKRLTTLGKTTIYQYVKDNKFPKPLRLGANKIRWRQDEVVEWLESLPRV
ncbi:helix-turn-helix transcriptional regulator [Brucella pseudogrignonensis]|uniref:helix-turn-helix transcriptional regulator n=2 Tax=Brucella pseudogrignonensis TaxID=419475 RepID=UPI003BA0E973